MGCTSSKEEWQDQTPGRRVTRTQFDYRNPGAAGSKLRPEPSIYGDAFQTYAAGRSTTFHERIRPQDVEPKTYKRRPAEFTNEMEKEYGWYKELAKQNRKYRDGYAAKCQRLGGLQKMTEEEHHEMQMMCEGKVDETTEDRIRASPMLHGHNQESMYRAGFNHKYPYAYSTYQSKIDHQNEAIVISEFPAKMSDRHKKEAVGAAKRDRKGKGISRR